MSLPVFFAHHPVFTTHELDAYPEDAESAATTSNEQTRKRLLQYHQKRGHVVLVRRGLYAAIPVGRNASSYMVDSYLVAARVTDDAVLAYQSALSLHGIAHSVIEERVCLSEHERVRPFSFQGITYRAVKPPSALHPEDRMALGVEEQDRQGLTVRVTALERTLVDVLDRPNLTGGWEEAWRSLESLDVYLDLDFVIRYTLLLKNATTAAKVGYFLDVHRDRLSVEDRHITPLRERAPKTPHAAVPTNSRHRAPTDLIRSWNLRVPVLAGEMGGGDPEE